MARRLQVGTLLQKQIKFLEEAKDTKGVFKPTLVGNITIVKFLSHEFIYYLIITIIFKFHFC